MEKKIKFRVVVFANGFKHVRYSDDKSELEKYADNIVSVCRDFHFSYSTRMYVFDLELGHYVCSYFCEEFFNDEYGKK